MRHVVGFTKKITEQPFHILEISDQPVPFSVGQFVKTEPTGNWLQIYQIGTRINDDQLYTTVVIGDLPPAGALSDGENWSEAPDWTGGRRQ
ncbi:MULTISPECIES: hypothetical protein [Rhizobium]|uniref:hypothetical protein n=1 Tax=Rhizobium TaxID=379 RepID=UPI0008275577|nr:MULTISPECIES: hypothetical protein [Rhizobium]NTF42081.1 hypothetical protein [Rhizobium rhizogenes]OCJ12444.1 hypothetical protein A6U86_05315 [Rhizobium sp. AC27/96]TIX89037.1 hypothetical protein BSK43_020635 [Rhizobium sp. P44RR-XXIV]